METLLFLTSALVFPQGRVGWIIGRGTAGQKIILETAMSIWDLEKKVQTFGICLTALAEEPQQHLPLTAEVLKNSLGVEISRRWIVPESDCCIFWL